MKKNKYPNILQRILASTVLSFIQIENPHNGRILHLSGNSYKIGIALLTGVLATAGKSEDIIRVGSRCNEESNMLSLTTEHYGLICGVCGMITLMLMYGCPETTAVTIWIENAVLLLMLMYGCPETTAVTIWIDNAVLLLRMDERNNKKLQLTEYAISDYGLYWLLCTVLKAVLSRPII